MTNQPGVFRFTIPVVMDFPNLFEPKQIQLNGRETGKFYYSAMFLFDPENDDLKQMKKLAVTVAQSKWPGRDFKASPFVWPFKAGTQMADARKAKGKEDQEYLRGKICLRTKTEFPPALCGLENGKIVDYDETTRQLVKEKFYRGVEVLALINFVPYTGIGGNADGLTTYIQMVFSTGKGKRLGSSRHGQEIFKGYMGQLTEENPLPPDDDIVF